MKKYVAILLIALMMFSLTACRPEEQMYNPNEGAAHITAPVEDDTPAPEEETPAPEEETPAPEEETPAPEEETPAPEEETPAPEEETPAPEEETPAPEEETPSGDTEINYEDWTTSCMTFNVLKDRNPGTEYADPDVRAPWILDTIVRYDPDLLGLQEVTKVSSTGHDMYTYLIDGLKPKGYDVIGMMDAVGKAGSKVAVKDYTIASGLLIMWKRDRFELKDHGAMVYSNDAGRHYQWAKLYDKKEDITILMTNTHMSINTKTGNAQQDAANGAALRAQQANELYMFWSKNCTGDMALYATGDYNHGTDAQAFANMIKGQYVSSRDVSQKSNANSSIDHVLINGEIQDCYKYHRCNETYEGGVPKEVKNRDQKFCPSDHYAVIAYCSNAYRS